MSIKLSNDAPLPRVCLITRSDPAQEYGYNLHAEKGKPLFIGTVNIDSAANRSGLRPGDRVLVVNGHCIIDENHKKVVQRIKENPLQCELIVISEEDLAWYEKNNTPVTLALPNVVCSSQQKERSRDASLFHLSSEEEQHHCLQDNSLATSEAIRLHFPTEVKQSYNISSTGSIQPMTNIPKPRLCRLRKRDPTEEFGFNLHAEKNRGHFVGAVDKNGIGERAGLQMGQRIVGVNGQLIYPSTAHKEVVSLIKTNPLRTELLVASEEVDQWYTENHMEYSFGRVDLYNFENGSSPMNEVKVFGKQSIHSNKNVSPNSKTKITASVAPLKQEADFPHHDETEKFERNDKTDKSGIPDIFKLSAGEARSRLVSRKKDPRRDTQMSLKEKYKLVSNM